MVEGFHALVFSYGSIIIGFQDDAQPPLTQFLLLRNHMSDNEDNVNPKLRNTPRATGGGLLDRRLFLRGSAALAGLSMVNRLGAAATEGQETAVTQASPPWMREPGAPFSNYGQPSPYESDVIRWVSANQAAPGNGVAWCPLHRLEGAITPNGLHFERHHNGVPKIDPEQHRLLIHGLVNRPLFFTLSASPGLPFVLC